MIVKPAGAGEHKGTDGKGTPPGAVCAGAAVVDVGLAFAALR